MTCAERPAINAEPTVRDDLAAAALCEHGLEVVAQVWDSALHPQPHDILIVRTTWDYHLKVQRFEQWLDDIEDNKQAMALNPIPVIRWNMHKKYLLDLANKGIPVAETKLLTKGSKPLALEKFVKTRGKFIIKPAIASSAFLLKRLQTEEEAKEYQGTFEEQLKDRDLIVQRYIDGICVFGEWSLMFFKRKFSHCVVKMPPGGDFRTFYRLGGPIDAADPTADMLELGNKIISLIPGELLYARIDLLKDMDGKLYLGELEFIEPSLFLDFDALAPQKFADAICSVMGNLPKKPQAN